jgi:SAM-dependent methyltransferase
MIHDLNSRLVKNGNFYIDTGFSKKINNPHNLIMCGKKYVRFMDFIYLPQVPYELKQSEVIELCDIRIDLFSEIVNYELNENIVACMTNFVEKHIEYKNCSLRTLDFGCGAGYSSNLIKSKLPRANLIGIDISKKAIKIAEVKKLKAKYVSKLPLPFPCQYFDVVFAVFVMHFNIDSSFLIELHRILKKKGIFIFNVYGVKKCMIQDKLRGCGFSDLNLIASVCLSKEHRIYSCSKT